MALTPERYTVRVGAYVYGVISLKSSRGEGIYSELFFKPSGVTRRLFFKRNLEESIVLRLSSREKERESSARASRLLLLLLDARKKVVASSEHLRERLMGLFSRRAL